MSLCRITSTENGMDGYVPVPLAQTWSHLYVFIHNYTYEIDTFLRIKVLRVIETNNPFQMLIDVKYRQDIASSVLQPSVAVSQGSKIGCALFGGRNVGSPVNHSDTSQSWAPLSLRMQKKADSAFLCVC